MGAENLERAVAEAIERSRPVAADLRREINGLVGGLMQGVGHDLSGGSAGSAPPASGASSPPGADGLRAYADDVVRAVVRELEELTKRRLGDELGTFNLVLFGRTGTGKSSLTEALTQGFGCSISPDGASDWTTGVAPGQWRGCRVVDTPGTNGWGRTKSRSELEETAREALVSADVVILCFDSQSQQEGEFAKVADWVADYGKPVVAFLNNRSSMWRFPTRVPQQEIRRRLSRSVAEHAENIRDELARIGLHDVPVVALNTKRAVFARASLPYQGPDADSLSKHRAEAGSIDVLLDWSNLPALESLLATALGRDAVGLRLGALVSQIGGACRNADDRLRVHVEEPALRLAEQTEIGIEGLAIRQVRAARLTDRVVEFLDRGLGRALRNGDPEERKALAERLDRWTEDPDLQAVVEQWWAESADEITVWWRRTAHSFRRRLGSKAFARTVPETGAVGDLRFLNGHPRRERRRKAAQGFGRVGALIGKAADGPVIARVATWFGRSLEPASLARGAVLMARTGMVLSVAGSVVDVYTLVRNVKEDQELARGRLAVSVTLRESGARWAEVITDGTEDEPGLLSGLDDDCEELSARVKETDERAAVYTRTTDALRDRIGTIREVIADALAHLGHEPVGHSARRHTEGER